LSIATSMNVAGRPWPELVQRLLDAPGHLERVRGRELFDDQEEAGAVVDDCVADERGMVGDDVGHIRKSKSFSVLGVEADLR
jgi:hypothetical protein